jgi:hypothetical protein
MCAEKKKRILLAESSAERDAFSNSSNSAGGLLGGWLSSVAGALAGGGGGGGTTAGHVKALRQELATWETLAGVRGGGWLSGLEVLGVIEERGRTAEVGDEDLLTQHTPHPHFHLSPTNMKLDPKPDHQTNPRRCWWS